MELRFNQPINHQQQQHQQQNSNITNQLQPITIRKGNLSFQKGNRSLQKQKQQIKDHQQLSQTIDQQAVGYNIVGEQSLNQVLQVNLFPKQRIFVRGKIIYANFDYEKDLVWQGYNGFIDWGKQVISSGSLLPFIKVHNHSDKIWYFGVSHTGGKLLTIDSDAYGNDIYYSPSRLILSNAYSQNSKTKKHTILKNYINRMKQNEKGKQQKTVTILQSSNSSFIIEKYLGPKQKFYCQQKRILALSGTIKGDARMINQILSTKLQGPGWIFIDSRTSTGVNKFLFVILVSLLVLLFALIEVE